MGLGHTDPSYRQAFSAREEVVWTQQRSWRCWGLTPTLHPRSGHSPETWVGVHGGGGGRARSAHESQTLFLHQKLTVKLQYSTS